MQKSRKKSRHILVSDFHITHQDNTKIWKEKQENRGRKKKLNTKKSRYDQDQQELQRQRWHINENWLQTNMSNPDPKTLNRFSFITGNIMKGDIYTSMLG
jgi:hypothetical protein